MNAKALDKKALGREIERDLRAKARAKIVELRERIRTAKKDRKVAIVNVKQSCKIGRERAKLLRVEALAAAKEAGRLAREAAKSECSANTKAAKSQRPIDEARIALESEQADQRALRRIDRGNRQRASERKATTAKTHRSESDDEVRANLPADLLPLFERMKKSIKGSARRSRTEEFLEYAETHEGEVLEALTEDGEAAVDRLVAELEARERRANPEPRGAAEHAAVRRYKRVHWGVPGDGKIHRGRAADPRKTSTALGTLVSVVYCTQKGGDGELVEYEHKFSRKSPPVLAFNREGLLIIGGSYRVEERGIVG